MPVRHALYAFGSNDEGELGLTPCKIVDTPTFVRQFDDIKTIRGGGNHTVALGNLGSVWGAGQNSKDQLGAGGLQNNRLVAFTKLRQDVFTCAATSDTTAFVDGKTWQLHTYGIDQFGELGCAENLSSFAFPRPVVDFVAGHWHYVAVLDNGDVWGWGRNRYGQLGLSATEGSEVVPPAQYSTPTKIGGIPFSVTRAICGKEFTYLVGDSATGEHKILGRDQHKLISSMPDHVRGWKDIGATWHAIFVLFEDGTLHGWGKVNQWKLIPPGLPRIAQIAVGTEHILAVTNDERLLSWGWGFHGNCGDLKGLEGIKPSGVVSGLWNEIKGIEGKIVKVAAGYATSFVVAETQQETATFVHEELSQEDEPAENAR
ncbi:regulator of chromosome condensation 1/beta-lactamase-inhibitor protein II [Lophiotrema nucula]|uniref:Regulator of chromosome condensation 1/beta-lactamase-inhibitor protein II n=1 Tax=Lophiotrema nucula TaxID=690887 RepID=A0A6A5YX03_9PLEO|nr:regulator of chromosome condensation 1/beta-lactamase-inhibitor protein II [Lophiotrema nucula]